MKENLQLLVSYVFSILEEEQLEHRRKTKEDYRLWKEGEKERSAAGVSTVLYVRMRRMQIATNKNKTNQ